MNFFALLGVHNCPDGWVTYKDHCYQINAHPSQKTSWGKAREECLSFNQPWKKAIDVAKADLVSITSTDEQDFLEKQYTNYRIYSGFFWTGLSRNNSEDFTWSDHSKINFQNWKNKPVDDKTKNCVKSSISRVGHGWEADKCSGENYFVCKLKRGMSQFL